MKNFIYFILSFLIVFLLGISTSKSECLSVVYNADTDTKIAVFDCHQFDQGKLVMKPVGISRLIDEDVVWIGKNGVPKIGVSYYVKNVESKVERQAKSSVLYLDSPVNIKNHKEFTRKGMLSENESFIADKDLTLTTDEKLLIILNRDKKSKEKAE